MQTLKKQKSSPLKYRNEPSRFFGDGAVFKAKLIGILEVGEARGDRMCQEALQDLKMAIRAAGEHKQKITIHVTIDGLRLRDEKTGDSLYHHPVHKISFIAQDMTDSRAFGYIFGSPDSGHRFFGIKTDKAASQVVLAMRDLFQVVFELKKKEIELARQHIQNKITQHEHQAAIAALTNKSTSDSYSKSTTNGEASSSYKPPVKAEKSPESVADLVDLEQELSSIQRGITQMERITPSEPTPKSITDKEDPFGDSFTSVPVYNLLPPPESSKRKQLKSLSNEEPLAELAEVLSKVQAPLATTDDWLNTPPHSATEMHESISFGEDLASKMSEPNSAANISTETNNSMSASHPAPKTSSDVFTDLDPLGTGKIKPYVDKKYFFQDVKNPPKKLLRDLSGGPESVQFDVNFTGQDQKLTLSDIKNLESDLQFSASADVSQNIVDPFNDTNVDPFADDPFLADPFDSSFPAKSTSPGIDHQKSVEEKRISPSVFNGPLQVSLPPENWSAGSRKSESPTPVSTGIVRNRPSAIRQNTMDAISSLSSKKMMKPTIFSHSKFGKRDSNGINMRRLQESDSMSENEAPEPPPRPDSASHIEPPPLPPKKQLSDIIIRPTYTTNSSLSSNRSSNEPTRYDYLSGKKLSQDENAPPLPLPSRRLGKTDSSYPGPGRPQKKMEDDYLTPITASDIPTLLPPPQKKDPSKMTRGPRKTDSETSGSDSLTSFNQPPIAIPSKEEPALSDMTLSHLLSLGIEDMAAKLNVPVSKLSTMTLLELTSYLSEFIENSKRNKILSPAVPTVTSTPSQSKPLSTSLSPIPATFKVNFDQQNIMNQSFPSSDATFFAKFDDNFGEDVKFVADFDKLNETKREPPPPSADRYAVFREIIQQEIQYPAPTEAIETFEAPELTPTDKTPNNEKPDRSSNLDFDKAVEAEINRLSPNLQVGNVEPLQVPVTKIDTKITEKIAQAKDRYAALRDIIMVEDLFEKPPIVATSSDEKEEDLFESFDESKISAGPEMQTSDKEQNSPEINISATVGIVDAPNFDTDIIEPLPEVNPNNLSTSNKDDIEIDEYMNRAISSLSINSRGNLSPAAAISGTTSKSPTQMAHSANASTSPIRVQSCSKSPSNQLEAISKTTLNDMSTSPIPIQKSPIPQVVSNLLESYTKQSNDGSLSDVACATSPEVDANKDNSTIVKQQEQKLTPVQSNDNWAVFDQPGNNNNPPSSKESGSGSNKKALKQRSSKGNQESPCSSDGKEEWRDERKWPRKQNTSSSSRDVSPWEEENPDYRRRTVDRYGPPPPPGRHRQRMNSCDEDYEYDPEYDRSSSRRTKGMHGHPWSPPSDRDRYERPIYGPDHHPWSPEDDDRRAFERSAYERSTYGPPREPKSLNTYDRRDYKAYEKQKYYRERSRMDYPYDESYDEPYEFRGKRNNYENVYEGSFDRARAREYFYSKEKRSFESNESYDSRGRYGSGEIYGRADYRDRYMEKGRLLKGRNARSKPDLEQDSDNEMVRGRRDFESGSLQRGRPKAVPASLDDEVWGQKSWKRPASATEPERRLPDNRRVMTNPLTGSDGEKDRRFRRKSRSKAEPPEYVPAYATMRYPLRSRRDEYYDYEAEEVIDDDMYYARRQQYYKSTTPRSETRSMGETLKGEKGRYDYEDEEQSPPDRRTFKKSNSRDLFYDDNERFAGKFGSQSFEEQKSAGSDRKHSRAGFEFNDFEEPPPTSSTAGPTSSATGGPKFTFDDGGFESDFNSPASGGVSAGPNNHNVKSFRFSNDFSDKDSPKQKTLKTGFTSFETAGFSSPSNASHSSTTKLRFNENVKVSQFDASNSNMFEDDFSKADVEQEDQWNSEMPLKKGGSNKLSNRQQQDNIKKSESVNIFAKKRDDPFEDDPFFGSQNNNESVQSTNNSNQGFANFDANM